MKGFMHILEIVLVIMTVFIFISQMGYIARISSDWNQARLSLQGNDMLYSLDHIGTDWYNVTYIQDMVNTMFSDRVSAGIIIKNSIKPSITVGCVCTNEQAAELESILQDTKLNIKVHFKVQRIDPSSIIFSNTNDVVFLWGYKDLSPYQNSLRGYLGEDKGVVEFAGVGLNEALTPIQRDIFNLKHVSSATTGSTSTEFFRDEVGRPSSQITRYFSHLPYRINVSNDANPPLGTPHSCTDTYKTNFFFLGGNQMEVMMVDNSTTTCDVSVYADTDMDRTIEAGEGPFHAGDTFTVSGMVFTIKSMDTGPAWKSFEVLFPDDHAFGELNYNTLYPNDNRQEKIVLAKLATYTTTGNRVPSVIINYNMERGMGRTAWIANSTTYNGMPSDVSNLIRTMIVWASGTTHTMLKPSSGKASVFRLYKILNEDMVQPIEIDLVLDYTYASQNRV